MSTGKLRGVFTWESLHFYIRGKQFCQIKYSWWLFFWSCSTWIYFPMFPIRSAENPTTNLKKLSCTRWVVLSCCFKILFSPMICHRLIMCHCLHVFRFILVWIYWVCWISLFFPHTWDVQAFSFSCKLCPLSHSSPFGVPSMYIWDHLLVSHASLDSVLFHIFLCSSR